MERSKTVFRPIGMPQLVNPTPLGVDVRRTPYISVRRALDLYQDRGPVRREEALQVVLTRCTAANTVDSIAMAQDCVLTIRHVLFNPDFQPDVRVHRQKCS